MYNHVLRDHDAAARAGHFNEADPHGAGQPSRTTTSSA